MAVLVAIIVVAILALPKSSSAVPLPGYLDRCVTGSLVIHSHPQLFINISGRAYLIPTNLGINGGCFRPLHTHDSSGVIHIETDSVYSYSLGDFFKIWGNWANNPTMAIFNSTQIFNYHADGISHRLIMTVNNNPIYSYETPYEKYLLPNNADPNSNPARILIYYT